MNIFSATVISEFFRDHYFLFLSSIFLGTFAVTWYIIPKIIWVSREKNLTKPVIARSVHDNPVPSFGGVAFFLTIILTLSLVQALRLSYVGNHLIAAVTILFLVGVKDDLVISTARVKLIGQFLAIAFLVFSPELEITSLFGFLGIEGLPAGVGYALAGFILLALINSYNLIDGIDGLAAVTGIIIGVIYTVVFYFMEEHFYVLVSMMLVGILSGFLRFNYSRGSKKIFMGDSGSLTIGLLIGFLTLRMLHLPDASLAINNFLPENRLLFVLAVLFLPFFDTTRSILIRLLNKKSPFSPDRNHTHHVMLDAGCNHIQATLLLGLFNCSVVAVFLVLATQLGSIGMSLVMLGVFGASCWMFDSLKKWGARKAVTAEAEDLKPEVGRQERMKVSGVKVKVAAVRTQEKKARKEEVQREEEELRATAH